MAVIAASAVMAWSCTSDAGVEESGPKIKISLEDEVPVAIYPTESIDISVSITYENGIAESYVSLAKTELEGTRQVYENYPTSASFDFSFVPQDSHTGTTLDFMIHVTGADGNIGRYDVPVYILAAKPQIEIIIPADAPSETDVKDAIGFNVSVTSGNTDIRSISTYRGDVLIEESVMTEFNDPRNAEYPFSFTPDLADVGAPLTFRFEVMDVNGNIVSSLYQVTVTKQASVELSEFYGIVIGMNKCTTAGSFLDLHTGTVYKANGVSTVCDLIDLAVFRSGNATTQGPAIASPNVQNVTQIFPEATIVTTLGGTVADIPLNWTTRNETLFKEIEMTAEEFASLETKAQVEAVFNNSASAEVKVIFKQLKGKYFTFKTHDGYIGVGTVTAHAAANTGSITIDYKIVK